MSTKEVKKDDLPKSALELLEEDDEFEVLSEAVCVETAYFEFTFMFMSRFSIFCRSLRVLAGKIPLPRPKIISCFKMIGRMIIPMMILLNSYERKLKAPMPEKIDPDAHTVVFLLLL